MKPEFEGLRKLNLSQVDSTEIPGEPLRMAYYPPAEVPLGSMDANPWGAGDALYPHDGGSDGRTPMTSDDDDTYTALPDDEIRRILGLGADEEVSLRALMEPPTGWWTIRVAGA